MTLDDYISKIELEDWYISEEFNTTSLYFTAPKEMLKNKYPEAELMTIGIEFPTNRPEACDAYIVCCSPTKYNEDEDCYSDYDWFDVDMPYEDIEKLLDIAERASDKWKK